MNDRRLFLGLEETNEICPLSLPFSFFWNRNVYNCYTVPVPLLYFGNRQLISSFTVPEMERNSFPRINHTQGLTYSLRLDNEIRDSELIIFR